MRFWYALGHVIERLESHLSMENEMHCDDAPVAYDGATGQLWINGM